MTAVKQSCNILYIIQEKPKINSKVLRKVIVQKVALFEKPFNGTQIKILTGLRLLITVFYIKRVRLVIRNYTDIIETI